MADIVITATSVLPSTGAVLEDGIAGAATTAGQTVYKKTSDSKFYLCDITAASVAGNAEIDNFYGIAMNNAAAGQALEVQKAGVITIGATIVAGTIYVLTNTPGGISAWADLVSTDYVTVVGIGITTGTIKIVPIITGIQIV